MKFSIVTPTYNAEAFLEKAIESVLSQKGGFEIEYIVMDGGSSDSTVEIARRYEALIKSGGYQIGCRGIAMSVVSEKDAGMYDAINRGFGRATGDVYAWINADDSYLPGALEAIDRAMEAFPQIEWIKGRTVFTDEQGRRTGVSPCCMFNRSWIQRGIYGRNAYFINQDSVFWRRSLWEKAGPIDASLKLAGDYDLWIKLSRYAELWSLNLETSAFRTRKGQLSENEGAYRAEQRRVSAPGGLLYYVVKAFFWGKSSLGESFEPLFRLAYPVLFWKRKREYVTIVDSRPIIRPVSSYRPS